MNNAFIFLCAVMVPAFIFSKTVITIAMIGITSLGLFSWWMNGKETPTHKGKTTYSFFFLLFIMVLLSGLNSHNTEQWLVHLRIKLPFIFLPAAFFFIGSIERSWFYRIHVLLIIVLLVTSIPVLNYIFNNYESVMDGLARGQPISTPVEHVKYSLMNAYGMMASFLLVFETRWMKGKWHKILTALAGAILFIYLHILAVRTGMAVAYISLIAYISIKAYQAKRPALIAGGLFVLAMVLTISIQQLPTLKQKLNYMMYDLKMYTLGQGEMYSDSDRLQSYQVGLDIIKRHPLFGVGIGDMTEECRDVFETKFGRKDFVKLPHNQFIFLTAGCGITGLLLFLAGFYGPLIRNQNYTDFFLLFLYLNYSLSFLVENSLERSFSVGFFITFALLSLLSRKPG